MTHVLKPSAESRITLWTYHPSSFRLDDAGGRIDSSRGRYWNYHSPDRRVRYRLVLRRLQALIETDQFLWCCTTRGKYFRMTTAEDLVEWELDVPHSQVLRFYREAIWAGIIEGRDDWSELFVAEQPCRHERDEIGALVRFPMDNGSIKSLGPPPPKY